MDCDREIGGRVLKFRYPDLNFIFYVGIISICAIIISLPIVMLDSWSRGYEKTKIVDFLGGGIIFAASFFLLITLPALVFLNIYWKKFTFDSSKQLLIITRNSFFFPLGKKKEIPFDNISLEIERSSPGDLPGIVWWLILITPEGRYSLLYSIAKKRLEKRKERIVQILHQR